MKRALSLVLYGIGHASSLIFDLLWRHDENEGFCYYLGLPFWKLYQTTMTWSWRLDRDSWEKIE